MDAPVAKPSSYQGNLDNCRAQILGLLIQNRRMAVAVSGKPHKTTCMALGQIKLRDHLPDAFTLGLWG
ncbi:MAG: hypothetical protein K8H84_11600 [Sulfuricella denitrificans]|nr:hypothetical protein [Sulfuricella denitrificans]